jgi:hypothetical protein
VHTKLKDRPIWSNAVFLVLACLLCGAVVAANTPTKLLETEALAANARTAIERMPAESRLETIEDARLRRATQVTYRAVAELADVREANAGPALYAKFLRAFSTFEEEAARRGHANCALNCKADDEAACQKTCKSANKKSCGCKLITFGCVVAECLF